MRYVENSVAVLDGLAGLLIRPRPMAQESAISYVIRIAHANGFLTPRQLWHAVRSYERESVFDGLMRCVGVTPEAQCLLSGPLPTYWHHSANIAPSLSVTDYNHSCMRWCPQCLKMSQSLQGAWGLKLQYICSTHQILLDDQCPSCGEAQRFERSDISRCQCGAALSNVEPLTPTATQLRLCKYLADGSPGNDSPAFPAMDAAAWHRMIFYLGQFSPSHQPRRPGKLAGLHRLENARTLVTNTASLLDDWPKNFNVLLSAIQHRTPKTQSLQQTFGRFYRVLYRDLQAPCFQFLRDAFEVYLHAHWWGLVCKRNRSLRAETVADHPNLTIEAAALLTGMGPAVIKHMVQAELIQGVVGELPSGRHFRSVHRNGVDRISHLAQEAMTLQEAANALVLPRRRIRELVAAEVLTPVMNRKTYNSAAWLFSADALKPLATISGGQRSSFNPVQFGQILKFWRLRDGEFVSLVKAIRMGIVVPIEEQPTAIGRLTFDATAVKQWLEEQRSPIPSFSVDEAARRMKLKQQVVYDLVRRKKLATVEDELLGKRVTNDALDRFAATYISLADISRSAQRSPRWLLRNLRARPVTGPLIDGSRQYFFQRTDLSAEELALLPMAGPPSCSY